MAHVNLDGKPIHTLICQNCICVQWCSNIGQDILGLFALDTLSCGNVQGVYILVSNPYVWTHPSFMGCKRTQWNVICDFNMRWHQMWSNNQMVLYAPEIDSLMYAMVATRPDIAHVVGVINWFMHNPDRSHWSTVKHVFRYLVVTKDYRILFGPNNTLGSVILTQTLWVVWTIESQQPDIALSSWLLDVRDGRDTAWHCACCRCHQLIHA